MFAHLVLTVIGLDRPGLVQLVASRVADHGGNWLESRLCHLGGQFAGIVRVEVPVERVPELRQAVGELDAEGLRVSVDAGEPPAPTTGGVPAAIELVGQDRPGILRNVTNVLATHGVNVEELSSERISAPMSGGRLFQARVRVSIPPGVTIEAVREGLEKIAADLMVDLTLRPSDEA